MKKCLQRGKSAASALLRLFLCLGLIFLFSMPASAEETAVISVKNIRAKPGDSVTVQILVSKCSGFCGFGVALEYDAGLLTFDRQSISASSNYLPDYTGNSPKYTATNLEGGCGYPVLFQCTLNPQYPNITEACVLVQATFRVSASAKDGAYPLTPHIDCDKGCFYRMGEGLKTFNLPVQTQSGYLLIGNANPPSPAPSDGNDSDHTATSDQVSETDNPSMEEDDPFPQPSPDENSGDVGSDSGNLPATDDTSSGKETDRTSDGTGKEPSKDPVDSNVDDLPSEQGSGHPDSEQPNLPPSKDTNPSRPQWLIPLLCGVGAVLLAAVRLAVLFCKNEKAKAWLYRLRKRQP